MGNTLKVGGAFWGPFCSWILAGHTHNSNTNIVDLLDA